MDARFKGQVAGLTERVEAAERFGRQAAWTFRVLSALGGLVLFLLAVLRYSEPLGRLLVNLSS